MSNIKTLESYIELNKWLIERPAFFGINRVEDISFVLNGYRWRLETDEIRQFNIAFTQHVQNVHGSNIKSEGVVGVGADYPFLRCFRCQFFNSI